MRISNQSVVERPLNTTPTRKTSPQHALDFCKENYKYIITAGSVAALAMALIFLKPSSLSPTQSPIHSPTQSPIHSPTQSPIHSPTQCPVLSQIIPSPIQCPIPQTFEELRDFFVNEEQQANNAHLSEMNIAQEALQALHAEAKKNNILPILNVEEVSRINRMVGNANLKLADFQEASVRKIKTIIPRIVKALNEKCQRLVSLGRLRVTSNCDYFSHPLRQNYLKASPNTIWEFATGYEKELLSNKCSNPISAKAVIDPLCPKHALFIIYKDRPISEWPLLNETETIKGEYKKKVLEVHPDRSSNKKDGEVTKLEKTEATTLLNSAFETIKQWNNNKGKKQSEVDLNQREFIPIKSLPNFG